jgi:uncharacterized protein (DUF1778 family)
MATRGRPPREKQWRKCERLDLRVDTAEKEAFKLAADQANQELSVWIRIQLHRAAEQGPGTAGLVKVEGQRSPMNKDQAE